MTLINTPVNLLGLTPPQLQDFLKSLGEPPAIVSRMLQYIYRDYATDFAKMSELPLSLRQKLPQNSSIAVPEALEERVSADGQTRKVLLRLEDGRTIESALMFFRSTSTGRDRRTVCVSSQVGCPVGCGFCATGQQKFERNLSAAEIIGQILFFLRRFRQEIPPLEKGKMRKWLTNVVFMGMGEPLANYDNVRQAIAIMNSPKTLGLGFHQVTLSTSGLVPQIRQFTAEKIQFQLAVSLHAANDTLRNRLVPINKKYPLSELMAACKEYTAATGRNVFIEYALFDGVNDSMDDADELVRLLDGLKCSINLISGNNVPESGFLSTPRDKALTFQKKLIAAGIRTMLRVSRGADIAAGCGQLRSRWQEKNLTTAVKERCR